MSRKLVSALSAAALLLASPAATLAQAPVSTPAPAATSASDNDPATYARKLELAKRYMKAARMDEIMRNSMNSMGSMMAQQMAGKNPNMSEADTKAVMDAEMESVVVMMKKMIDQMIPIIAKIYTEDELIKITEFMESPAGQSMLNKAPLLNAEVLKAMPNLLPDFMEDLQTRMCKKIDCTAPEMAAPKPSAT
jgi:hypothetical protein